MEGIILLAGVVFFILSLYIYNNRNNNDAAKLVESLDTARSALRSVEENQRKILDETKAFSEVTTAAIADLNKRLTNIETKDKSISVHFNQPIELVYKSEKKIKQPLLERAGLPPKENN